MPFVQVTGRSIEYEWVGKGAPDRPTLVFLHEGLGSIRQWRDFPQRVASATGCAALVYARYGHGQSDLPQRLSRSHRDAAAMFRGWSDVWLSPAFRDWNIEASLPRIRCPVLAIQGADDEYGVRQHGPAACSCRPRLRLCFGSRIVARRVAAPGRSATISHAGRGP